MGIVITKEDIKAYAEVDYIIHHMNEKYIDKIPKKLLTFFATIKDPVYEVYVDPKIPLQNQNLAKYTLEIIALLHLKYWCEDEERRKMLYEKMMDNQRKLDEQMREKYNIDNMFGLNSATVVKSEDDLMEENYTRPKSITKYDIMSEDDSDIEDYIDAQDEKYSNYLNKSITDNLKETEKAIVFKTGFFVKIINKIKNMFLKK